MKNLIKQLGVAAVACGMAASAYAVSTSEISYSTDGGTTWLYLAADNGAGDGNGNLGEINAIISTGGWNLNVVAALSKPSLGSAAAPEMDLALQGTATAAAAGTTIKFRFSDIDFTPVPGGFSMAFSANNNTSVPGTYNAYVGGNSLYDFAAGLGTLGPVSGATISINVASPGATPDPYSITLVTSLTRGTGSANLRISTDASLASLASVPDGGSALMLLGTALSALAFYGRSRKV